MLMLSVTVTVNFKDDGVCRQRNLVQLDIETDLHLDQTYQTETTLDRLDPEWFNSFLERIHWTGRR